MEITVNNISKKFGNKEVLKNVSLIFGSNDFTGILGPNGAGKSTLMKIITGQIKTQKGSILWIDDNGKRMKKNEKAKLLGFVHQNSVLDNYLTVKENLIFRGTIKGLSSKQTNERINHFNNILDIKSISKIPYGKLSGGQKRRVDIVAALLHKPKILILDEPTTGIDPEIRNNLWSAIHKIRIEENLSIILITHYLEEMKDVNQLVVLINGKINFNGSPKSFVDKFSNNSVNLFFENKVIKNISYNSLYEKIKIINDGFNQGNLVEFKDEHQSLENAYLKLLKNKETNKCLI